MNHTPIGIDNSRLLHMRAVGRLSEHLARTLYGWDDARCRQMFLMGFLHDVGYEYVATQPEHEHYGGELLRESGFAFWEAVSHHGDPDAPTLSPELIILNTADLSVDSRGQQVGFDARLTDIARRYGSESTQFIRAKRLADRLAPELDALGWSPYAAPES